MRAFLQRLFSPPTQHLRVLKPTPSTACYTVSTRSIPTTLPGTLAHHLPSILNRLLDTIDNWHFVSVLEPLQWPYLAPSALLLLYLALRRNHTEESLLVLRGLGIQTSTSSPTYLQSPTTRFIPTTSIQDVVIHEAFRGFEVRFYLAIVVEGEEDVVVVFPRLLPKRKVLEEVWRGARGCLWEGKGMGG
ncbi:hypothetical protein EK21DRAFT_75783 [Setomelanomma holmii]|uniref:Phosphatidylinositol N-acetylglucosaminyltransferase subunit H conserved domain-containing protein n=1 Tax=Setomelanomma holmii TaxID=210430 RepID=A0A9P4H2T9_9PLEO|nr:hypothetical protein EK21DRAFT_75783 [Setomelanomma holmii]